MIEQILTCDEVRAAEQRAVASGETTMAQLMERAGEACARVLHEAYPTGRVSVLAGPGNNGGDAFVAARFLRAWGRDVQVCELERGGERSPEGAAARAAWGGEIKTLGSMAGDVVLDGLFGAGLSRRLDGAAAKAVGIINAAQLPVVAIDVPSGVRGDSGAFEGFAFDAAITVTFGCLKPAHVLQPGVGKCGRVVVEEIGFGDHLGLPILLRNAPALWSSRLQWPSAASHKHERGRLFVVTGGMAQTGAARLAARGGQRVAGWVTLLCPSSALMVVAQSVEAAMTQSFDSPEALVAATDKAHAVVIGPAAGVDAKTRANVEALGAAGRRLVLDADALGVFAGEVGALRKALQAPPAPKSEPVAAEDMLSQELKPKQEPSPFAKQQEALARMAVLTPHTGEFERLFPGLLASSTSKIEATRKAAAEVGHVVLLKGADTVVASPDGRAVVNTHATPFLATAGSGDVLAGIIGGLMAQGMSAYDAACAGVWMHGDAGLRAGPGLTAEDLPVALRDVIRALYESR